MAVPFALHEPLPKAMTEMMPVPRRFRFVCAYDGTAYFGWQTQPGYVSLQETIEQVLAGIVKAEKVEIHASGRTDHGVHARGQVFHCDLVTRMSERSLKMALNAHGRLPPDIRITSCREVPTTFHARFSVEKKEYRYYVWNTRLMPPTKRLYNAHIVRPLDVAAMQAAANLMLGTHDFAAFAANPNRPIASTVRTLYAFEISKRGSQICFRVQGNGFLYKMVRSLVGFLLRVGAHQEPPENVLGLLVPGSPRTARVPSAPACGLFLWHVWYLPPAAWGPPTRATDGEEA